MGCSSCKKNKKTVSITKEELEKITEFVQKILYGVLIAFFVCAVYGGYFLIKNLL